MRNFVKRRMGRDGRKWRKCKDLEEIGGGPVHPYGCFRISSWIKMVFNSHEAFHEASNGKRQLQVAKIQRSGRNRRWTNSSYCRGFRVEGLNGYDNRKRTPSGLIEYYNNADWSVEDCSLKYRTLNRWVGTICNKFTLTSFSVSLSEIPLEKLRNNTEKSIWAGTTFEHVTSSMKVYNIYFSL